MQRSLGRFVSAAALGLIAASWSPAASACDYALGFEPNCLWRGALPANGIIEDAELRQMPEELQALFEPAFDLRARFAPCDDTGETDCGRLHRLRAGAPSGTALRSRERWSCAVEHVVDGSPDVTAPATPVLADLVIEMKTDPADTGCYSCPDVDRMKISVTNVDDDRTAPDQMFLAIYVADTEEQAKTRTTFDHLIVLSTEGSVSASIGESVDRNRPIHRGVFQGGPRCMAVEVMDRGGNLSARSNVMCFDHANENDPHVQTEEGGCACRTTERPSSGTAIVTGITAVVVVCTRRRRRLAAN